MPDHLRSGMVAFAVAWMVLAGVILGAFADEPLPASYLVRPLVVATAVAVVLGVASLPFRHHGPVIAAAGALLLAAPTLPIVLSAIALLIGLEYLRRRGRGALSGERPAIILAATFLALGVVRAVPVIEVWSADPPNQNAGPPMYVILLDGYPRLDSLAAMGIDNRAFVDALEQRGFDHYPQATSIHTRTNKTLLALLTTETVTNDPVAVPEAREIRRRLVVPSGFLAVDPPVGYVTLGRGRHLDPGGVNDFEAFLVGRSAFGVVAPEWAWSLLLGDLRDRLDRTLGFLETSGERRVFAHFMVPHPPFLYGPDGSADVPRWCWPQCGLFDATTERLGVEPEVWWTGMASQLEEVNVRLVETIDAVLARHPDAVIVLFSDHGGRYSDADPEEMHRSFLAARTPGHPSLFATAPRPDTIIRTLLAAYE